MKRKLQTQISLTITLVVLITISLISILTNITINREFDKYVQNKQKFRTEEIAENLIHQYNAESKAWDVSFVHGIGMYALYDGYIVKLYDENGNAVWDAESHDMSLCSKMMSGISELMKNRRPDIDGHITASVYPLAQNGESIGELKVLYYGPYFFSEGDFYFLDTLNLLLFIVGLGSLVCALIAGWTLARRISKPISAIAGAASEISSGNYAIRFDQQVGTMEIDELAESVNNLAQNLRKQEKLRKKLTSDVAHELRTPLTAVSSHLEAMIEGIWEASPERLQSCYDEIIRISELVSDLEKLSTIEDENLNLKKTQIDLINLASESKRWFEAECGRKGISFSVSGDSSIVMADRERLGQVFVNIISNAIKYSPENGEINIVISDSKEYGEVSIEDTGIGIDKEDIPYIFERFYRTDRSRNRKTGGAGIGLSIVKAIIDAHGGSLDVYSEGKNRGSKFTFTIPKK